MQCINGHDVNPSFAFCPICDAAMHRSTTVASGVKVAPALSNRGVATGAMVAPASRTPPLRYGGMPLSAADRELAQPVTSTKSLVDVSALQLFAGVVVVASAFLPWVGVPGSSTHARNAFHIGDPWTTSGNSLYGPPNLSNGLAVVLLGVAIACSSLSFFRFRRVSLSRNPFSWDLSIEFFIVSMPGVLGAILFYLVILKVRQLKAGPIIDPSLLNSSYQAVSIGPGPWVCLAGAALSIVAGVLYWTRRERS